MDVRRETKYVKLTKEQFRERYLAKFFDPSFDAVKTEIEKITDVAYDNYVNSRKAPRRAKAGDEFQNPEMELSTEWLAARAKIQDAETQQRNPKSPSRILVINGSSRNEHTCPSEISKTSRLAKMACEEIQKDGFEIDYLDLSVVTVEYGKNIYPCKACVSTAMPLCHWPCSCYPNHSLGQTSDWMFELYPRWVAAHGVIVLCPVNWYQVPSPLKLMIDRLVCADGGNADPTTTAGKDPAKAKEIELAGWDYPKHLKGRAYAVVVHGDAAGTETLRRILCDWLNDLGMYRAGKSAAIDRYIGYYEPYATSHEALDKDTALHQEVRNAAKSVVELVKQIRSGKYEAPDAGLRNSREK